MKVTPIATTELIAEPTGYQAYSEDLVFWPKAADELAEMAGRACYQSWSRPNPATATNSGYLKNIIDQGHFSVLEHASISFYVEGVSRALLTELERHRFLSFSVISQRYVKMERAGVVKPPAIVEHGAELDEIGWSAEFEFDYTLDHTFSAYNDIANRLAEAGLPKKKALEAARSVLPNATETKFVVTGNVRCWRDVISKRYHEAADAEIRAFATEVLKHLRVYAPSSVQDIPEVPYV